jgi:cytochrome d ubiquinol oxidase subunit I
MTAQIQPAKFAAMEGLYETQPAAPLTLGGWPDNDARTVRFGLEIPYALSFLAHGDPQAPVTGLNAFPPEDWPNPVVTHLAFDVMVGCGTVLFVLALWGAASWLRRRRMPEHPRFLAALVVAGPLGFIALEAGWTVTEVGRQPWIIYGVLRTAAAVTSQPGLAVPFVVFTLLYLFLSVVVIFLLRRQFLETSPTVSSPVL